MEIIFIEDGSADSEQNEFQLAQTFDIDYARIMADRFHQMELMTILSNCAKGAYLDAQFKAVKPQRSIHPSIGMVILVLRACLKEMLASLLEYCPIPLPDPTLMR